MADRPSSVAFKRTFSKPVNSGLKPAPSSSRAEMRPRVWTLPPVGVNVPLINCKRVDFPEPLRPIIPIDSPELTSKVTSRNAQNSHPAKHARGPASLPGVSGNHRATGPWGGHSCGNSCSSKHNRQSAYDQCYPERRRLSPVITATHSARKFARFWLMNRPVFRKQLCNRLKYYFLNATDERAFA